jgi:hypothetical protein
LVRADPVALALPNEHGSASESSEMGTLVISRTREYANSFRRCSILVDGSHAAYVRDSETTFIPVEVEDGNHEVLAEIDWCRSKPIRVNVEPGFTIHLRTGCYARGWRVLLAGLYVLVPGWYLYVEPAETEAVDGTWKVEGRLGTGGRFDPS